MTPVVRWLAVVLMGCALAASGARAATVRVLFRTGDAAADGVHLDAIEGPIATGRSMVVFRSGTSALLVKVGETLTAVARTGDPLSAPLTGTFNDFGDPVINDRGALAFRAGLNSPDAGSRLFFYEAGAFFVIGPVGGRVIVDINDEGDVLLLRKKGKIVELWRRARAALGVVTDRRTAVAGIHEFLRFGGRPVLSDAGVVALTAQFKTAKTATNRRARTLTGIFAALPAGLVLVAREGDPSPIPGGSYGPFGVGRVEPGTAIAINAAGQVAFTASVVISGPATSAVFLYDPATGSTTVVAKGGDEIDGAVLVSISLGYVGIDSSGRVAFVGCFSDGSCRLILASGGSRTVLSRDIQRRVGGAVIPPSDFAPRLTDGGYAVWKSGDDIVRYDGAVTTVLAAPDVTPIGAHVATGAPSINNSGVVAFRARREGLYRFEGDAARAVVAGGDALVGGGTLQSFGAHAVRSNAIAFEARETDGRNVIALRRETGSTKLVASGEPTPIGGTFELLDESLDVERDSVVFASAVSDGAVAAGLFQVGFDGGVSALARGGQVAPGGGRFASFGSVLAGGKGSVIFTATLDDGGGIFALRASRVMKIARSGDRLPGRGRHEIVDLGPVAASQGRVLFAARAEDRDDEQPRGALLFGHAQRLRRVARSRGRAPGGGRFDGIFPALGLDGRVAAFVASLGGADGEGALGLFLRHGRVTQRLVTTGVAAGETVDLGEVEGRMSLVGETVILRADVIGDAAKEALLSIGP